MEQMPMAGKIPAFIDKLRRRGGVPEETVSETPLPQEERTDVIDLKAIEEAIGTLQKYKDGKANFEQRIVDEEQWWKLRHWELIRKNNKEARTRPEPASAWLFNSLVGKHSDFMDNVPEPNVLPRQRDDEADADTLSAILPVVMDRNNYEKTYSDATWYKLKHGVSAKGVFWNNELEDGMGDVDVKFIDMLSLFWQPGIRDLQASRNLFIVALKDNDLLEEEYPELKGRTGGKLIDVKQYVHDDSVDTSDKTLVIDWYYKKRNTDGKTVLHYCKFVEGHILYASENDPLYRERGYYDHGRYPVEFDVLFPEEGTPIGFGYVAVMKEPQLYIDKLSQLILENAADVANGRYWIKKNSGINEEEFLDKSKKLVHVEGDITEERLRLIDVQNVPATVLNTLQMKIDELKETSSNRDVSQGATSSGVTSGAAISALQEAGNKVSRSMITASYRAYTQECYLVIELMRQFYTEARSFRITGETGKFTYRTFDNRRLAGVPLPPAYAGQELEPDYQPAVRKPVFDIVVKPQKRSPYSKLAQNELAKELYGLGVFSPQLADQTLALLDMMEFDGIEKVRDKVQEGQTLYKMVMQMRGIIQNMGAALMQMGINPGQLMANAQPAQPNAMPPQGGTQSGAKDSLGSAVMESHKQNQTSYGERLAKRAKPDMNNGNG